MHFIVLVRNLHNSQRIKLKIQKILYFPINKHNTLYLNVIMWCKGYHSTYYLMYQQSNSQVKTHAF